MKNIITKDINSLQFVELRDTMYSLIRESINALEYNGGLNDKKNYLEHLAWYKDCEMNDYFCGGFEDIYDEEDELIGVGLNTIAHLFVLNDDTIADFESSFEQARDEAYEIRMKEIAEEIEECDSEGIEYIKTDGGVKEEEEILKKGGVRIAYDSDDIKFDYPVLQDIYDTGECIDVEKFAIWAGANVCLSYQGEDDFDYSKTYYRVENTELKTMSNISQKIKEYRRRACLTQQQIADRVGVPQQTIARLERGRHDAGVGFVAEVAAALGCELKIVEKE